MVLARPTRLNFKPHVVGSRFCNPGNFNLWNLESWALESVIQLKESGIPLTNGVWSPSSTDKESEVHYLESRTQGVESRIQDCLGLPYIGRE